MTKLPLGLKIAITAFLFAVHCTGEVVTVNTESQLNSAISNANPGDTILMANGTWTDIEIDFNTDGLVNQPITLRAEVDGQVTLEGSSKLEIAGDYLVVQGLHFTNGSIADGGHVISFRGSSSDLANHSRLTNCAITDYNPPDNSTNYKWVSIYGLYNRVDHCSFTGMNHIGVTLTVWLGTDAPANHTRIDHNVFADHAEGNSNGWETIRIGTSTRSLQESKAIVEHNYFYKCDGEIETISNKSVGNFYRYNTFESCKGQLTLRHGNECRIEGNFFLGNGVSGSSGVRIIGEDHVVINNYFENLRGTGGRAALSFYNGVPNSPLNRYFQVKRALVAFNTFSDCTENFVIGLESSVGDTTLAPLDCVIANNLVEGSDEPLIDYRNEPINMQYEGNIFHGAELGISEPSGIQITDPLLSRAADDLMRPEPDSPAIDAASGSYPNITTDSDGHTRTAGTKDIGADELSSSAAILKPLTLTSTGPIWMRPSSVSISEILITPTDAEIVFEDKTGLAPSYILERSGDLKNWVFIEMLEPINNSSTNFSIKDSGANIGNKVFWRVGATE